MESWVPVLALLWIDLLKDGTGGRFQEEDPLGLCSLGDCRQPDPPFLSFLSKPARQVVSLHHDVWHHHECRHTSPPDPGMETPKLS